MISNPDRQAAEYAFPYHHLPYVDGDGFVHIGRAMRGGLEYLSYLLTVARIVESLGPKRVLDVGCGDGRLLSELNGAVPEVVGVDLDERALAYAVSFAPDADSRRADVGEIEGRFDVVTCVETLEHVSDDHERNFLASVADRVLPGGHLIITVPSTARAVHEKHHRHYSVDEMRQRLGQLPGSWQVDVLEEIVPSRRWLEFTLRLLANRWWTFDAPRINRLLLRVHRRPVRGSRRGFHVLAVARRES